MKDSKKSNKKPIIEENIMKEEVLKPEVFADPTYDTTFKMLFADEKHKDILISFLNSVLNFSGDIA